MSKMEEKFSEFLRKREGEEKKRNIVFWILAVIGIVAAVAGIVYAITQLKKGDCLEDFEDDIDDEFDYDDDFFDDEDELEEVEEVEEVEEEIVDDTVE